MRRPDDLAGSPPPPPAAAAPEDAALQRVLQRWADGKATLKEVRGYTDAELYAVAKTAYFFFLQGRIAEARTLYQGLYAVNPVDPYFAKALGVIELAAGNAQGALQAYDVAIKLSPADPGCYTGRAEVKLALGQKAQAVEDLRKATTLGNPDDPNRAKAAAILETLREAARGR